MKNFKNLLLSALILGASCNSPDSATTSELVVNTDLDHLNFSVVDAPEWNALFNRTSGWFGADGIFALPQNGVDKASEDGETLLIFSDTMEGEIVDGKLQEGFVMIHNSVATLTGSDPEKSNIKFEFDTNAKGGAESIFVPNTPASQPGDYYWLGDGFVNTALNGDSYIFGYRIRDIKNVATFGFEHVGSTFIIIPKGSKPPYKDQRQIDIPFFKLGVDVNETTSFGSGIFVNTAQAGAPNPDGYVYVYGVRGSEKHLIAARVLPQDFENFDAWRFWDGTNWVAEMEKVANITDKVSNELSVSPLADGRYALIFQIEGISPVIGARLSNNPVGPFGPVINLYDTKDSLNAPKIFSYNAKAHPALSKPNELLVSYNVNSFDFGKDVLLFPNLYRPRFVKIKLQ